VTVDGARVFERKLGWANGGTQICGRTENNWNELILDVDVIIPHSSPTAAVAISSPLD